MRIPPEADVLCGMDNAVETVKHLIQFRWLLLILEPESTFALQSHPCDDSKSAQGAHGCVKDISLLGLGAINCQSSSGDKGQIQDLVKHEKGKGSCLVNMREGRSTPRNCVGYKKRRFLPY